MHSHPDIDRDDLALEAVAQAIADGRAVDWAAAARAACATSSPRIETLRLIAGVADAFASQRADDDLRATRSPVSAATGTASLSVSESLPAEPDPATRRIPVLFTWGPLQVLELLGRGAFGEVYRAFDPQLERDVALKLRRAGAPLDAEATQRFLAEARKLARIDHPNVLVVHGVDVHDGRVGIWTDLVHGKTLAQYVADNGPLGAEEAARIGLDLCCAVASLHKHDLVHRDLKPANVMRKSGGHIILMDFGSAGEFRPRNGNGNGEPGFFGTPVSTAPEVLLHGEEARPAHDVYSLGVLLYWLVSGRYPVEGRDYHDLLAKHAAGARTPLVEVRNELPPAFVDVVERAVDPNPERRFPTVGHLHNALSQAVSRPLPDPDPVPQPWWYKWILAAAAVIATVAIGLPVWRIVDGKTQLHVEATIYRDSDGTPEALADGGPVQPGDHLYMDIEGDRPMYVWVIDEDAHGDAFALYPLDSGHARQLPARQRHRLPGVVDGTELNWQVSDTGGNESILVVAARERMAEMERLVAALPRPGDEPPADAIADGSGAPGTRGIDKLVPRRRPVSTPSVIDELMRSEGLRPGQAGVWVWRMTLKSEGQ